jgi:hypothetical protein
MAATIAPGGTAPPGSQTCTDSTGTYAYLPGPGVWLIIS